jgi:Lecithin retinol acyltransferase
LLNPCPTGKSGAFLKFKIMNRNLELVNKLKLQPGDRVVVPKSEWKLVQHHALYLGDDGFGTHCMCENVIGIGVRLVKVEEFFKGVTKVTRIEKYRGNNYDRKVVVQKALSKLGQPYSLINYNCESFVNDVLLRKPHSHQVGNAFTLLALVVVIGALFKSN